MSDQDADIVAVMGASGSGKTAYLRWLLAKEKPRRLMVWDTMDQYADLAATAADMRALVALVKGQRRFAVRYVPTGDPDQVAARFDAFCAIAYALGEVCLVVEELQTVTKPSWAPAHWSACTLRGRHRGLSIYGAAQRPSLVDKNFFGNATFAWCGRLNFDADISTMAGLVRVAPDVIADLKSLQFVARDLLNGERAGGVISFKNDRPQVAARPL